MMFYGLVPWFLLMIAGLVMSVVLLFWGHRSGQFAETERARYLPFRDEEVPAAGDGTGRIGPEVYALVALMAGAGIVLAVALGVAVFRQYSG
jgi:hypothetical protein